MRFVKSIYLSLLILVIIQSLTSCTNFFFLPEKKHFMTPSDIGLKYEDVFFTAADGVKLHAWFLPGATIPPEAAPRGTILFLHGNAENISSHLGSVYWLPAYGFNVFLLDYRGFGRSEGTASLEGSLIDIEAAISQLIARKDINTSRLYLFAQSLGGSLGIYSLAHSANQDHFRAAVIESAFSNYRLIAREKLQSTYISYPLAWPLSLLITDKFNPIDEVASLNKLPLLFVHSLRDNIVPAEHSQLLYNAAREPKELWLVPDASHIATFNDPLYRKRLVDYFLAN